MRCARHAALLSLVLGMAGCSLGASGEEPLRDALLTRSATGDEDEMTGIPRGVLELDPDGGCILLSGKPVVWPAETTVTADPSVLELPGGLVARSGDTVSGGGGEIPAATIRDTALRIEGDLDRALACAPAESPVVVFTAPGEAMRVSTGD